MVATVDEIKQGDVITFKSLSRYDNTVWRGTVKGFCDYDVARTYDDVLATHKEVQAVVPEIAPCETLRFVLMKMQDNSANSAVLRIFALEWIEPGSLVIEDVGNIISIKVYNVPDTHQQQILDLLRSHGYVANIAAN